MSVFKDARKISLLDFLTKELNARPRVTASSVRLNACPNPKCNPAPTETPVSVTGELFRCFACGSRGDVSAAGALLWGVTPVQAARRLVAASGYARNVAPVVVDSGDREDAIRKLLTPLRTMPVDPIGADWLKSRSITESTIREAIKRGMLAFLPGTPDRAMSWLETDVGEEVIRKAGMWREGARAPSIIFRPVVFPGLSSAEFRLAREPAEREPKALRFGRSEMWVWQGEKPGYAIVSGMLDVLSLAQIGYRGTIYGLPGSTAWNSDEFPDPAPGRAQIVFEGGTSGSRNAETLRQALSAKGIEATIKPAHQDTGVNGVLMRAAA